MSTETPPKPHVSGWCSGPVGARLQCDRCRSNTCRCACHNDDTNGGE